MQIRNKSYKNIAIAGFVAFTALSSVLGASIANAAFEGRAKITLNQGVLATFKGANNLASADIDGKRFIYVNDFFDDSEFTYPVAVCGRTPPPNDLCNATPTNHIGLATDVQPYTLPAVPLSIAPFQAGNIGTNWNPTTGGSIGIAGAFKIRSDFDRRPDLSVRWGKFAVINTGSTWVLFDNLGGGSLFELANVQTEVRPGGQLQLEANLKFGNTDWANFLGGGFLKLTAAERQVILGKIKLQIQN
ncbi:MAG: hypothetical protein HOP02_12215 [Methylococcaceae bacterium]|nr:hypothetical protein [Methylococcaceae bacterium]